MPATYPASGPIDADIQAPARDAAPEPEEISAHPGSRPRCSGRTPDCRRRIRYEGSDTRTILPAAGQNPEAGVCGKAMNGWLFRLQLQNREIEVPIEKPPSPNSSGLTVQPIHRGPPAPQG